MHFSITFNFMLCTRFPLSLSVTRYFLSTNSIVQVVAAGADPDLKRSRHRLNLLSVSGINESLRVMNTGRVRAQNHLQVHKKMQSEMYR